MATLILHGDEKLKDIIEDGDCGYDAVPVFKIDVIIHKAGNETTILKSPHDGDGKIYK